MARKYDLKLKGYVGGYQCDPDYVQYQLDKKTNDEVSILVDSLGGNLPSALSIARAFSDHGNVTVYFSGFNASAATILALGAKKTIIDKSAMYLVHKCSIDFAKWQSMNSDRFKDLQKNIDQTIKDLDKIDINLAAMYSRKCKKNPKDLLDLMAVGGWLTSVEALEWGFVDEIEETSSVPAKLTASIYNSLLENGEPIPSCPIEENTPGLFSSISQKFAEFFNSSTNTPNPTHMNKFALLCGALGLTALEADKNNNVVFTAAQAQSLEDSVQSRDTQIISLQNDIAARDTTIAERDATIEDLNAKLNKQPAETTTQVVNTSGDSSKDEYSQCVEDANTIYNFLNPVK